MINSVLLLKEISTDKFVNDVKSMLLGIESDTFEYTHTVCILINYNKGQLYSKIYG